MHDLVPTRSVRLTALAIGLHAGGLAALLYTSPLAAWPAAVLAMAAALWRALAPRPDDVCRAQGQVGGEWTLTCRDGRRETGWQLDAPRAVCHPWLVILPLRRQRRRRYLPLAADAVNADALRRLRVSLRAAG